MGGIDETMSYEYDAGGLRTKLTLPGDLEVVYIYDDRGRLVSLTDWDDQATELTYDGVDRHLTTLRENDVVSQYIYDAASRLQQLQHEVSVENPFPDASVLERVMQF